MSYDTIQMGRGFCVCLFHPVLLFRGDRNIDRERYDGDGFPVAGEGAFLAVQRKHAADSSFLSLPSFHLASIDRLACLGAQRLRLASLCIQHFWPNISETPALNQGNYLNLPGVNEFYRKFLAIPSGWWIKNKN